MLLFPWLIHAIRLPYPLSFTGPDPQEPFIGDGYRNETGVCWKGIRLVEHHPQHWGCILWDRSEVVDERPEREHTNDFFLRSEIAPSVYLLRRQNTVWDGKLDWTLDLKFGPTGVSAFFSKPNLSLSISFFVKYLSVHLGPF